MHSNFFVIIHSECNVLINSLKEAVMSYMQRVVCREQACSISNNFGLNYNVLCHWWKLKLKLNQEIGVPQLTVLSDKEVLLSEFIVTLNLYVCIRQHSVNREERQINYLKLLI